MTTTPRTPPLPRIPPLEDPDPETAELLAKTALREGEPFRIFKVLAHHPRLLRRFNMFAGTFMTRPLLPLREREIVVLRVGWNCGAVYEFGQHTLLGRDCGLTDDEITRLTRPLDEGGWSGDDRLLVALADELCAADTVTDATWAGLAARFDTAQLQELVMLAGCYRAVSGWMRAVDLQREEWVPGWPEHAPTADDRPEGPGGRLVRRYFAACTGGTAEEIAACFTEDAVVYDTNHAPVRGAEAIGRFWVRMREAWDGARWQVDSLVDDGAKVAIEWTMTGRRHGTDVTLRGSEHYAFADERIREIRQYWTLREPVADTGLVGFPDGASA